MGGQISSVISYVGYLDVSRARENGTVVYADSQSVNKIDKVNFR